MVSDHIAIIYIYFIWMMQPEQVQGTSLINIPHYNIVEVILV